jgi:hypothetical protein
MTDQHTVVITITLQDEELGDEEMQEFIESLRRQMIEIDGVEQANLVMVETSPEGSRSLGGFLKGTVATQINSTNVKTLFKFLSDRLGGKTIKMIVETPDGRKINIEASSQSEFEFAVQQAKKFIEIV